MDFFSKCLRVIELEINFVPLVKVFRMIITFVCNETLQSKISQGDKEKSEAQFIWRKEYVSPVHSLKPYILSLNSNLQNAHQTIFKQYYWKTFQNNWIWIFSKIWQQKENSCYMTFGGAQETITELSCDKKWRA